MNKMICMMIAVLSVGCASSSRNANISGLTTDHNDRKNYRVVGDPIEKTSCTMLVALMYFGDATRTKRLVEEALKANNADVLIDARLRSTHIGLAPFLSRHCRTVKGIPAVKRDAAPTKTDNHESQGAE